MEETRKAYKTIVRNPEEKRPLERHVNGRILLKWILKKWDVDWIHVAQNRYQWQAVLNTTMSLWVP
jgi:hypothetical protein